MKEARGRDADLWGGYRTARTCEHVSVEQSCFAKRWCKISDRPGTVLSELEGGCNRGCRVREERPWMEWRAMDRNEFSREDAWTEAVHWGRIVGIRKIMARYRC